MDRQTLLDLIPAYVLGALDPDELREVEDFISNDAEAQSLLAEYQSFTDMLALTTPIRPAPAHLGDDLRKRLAADMNASAPAPVSATRETVETPRLKVSRPNWPMRVLAAAAVIAVVFFALITIMRSRSICDAACQFEQISTQENAVRVALVSATAEDIEGEMVAIPNSNRAIIRVNLADLPDDQTYQLWLIDEQGPKSAGLWPQPSGVTHILVPLDKPVEEYQALGMSVEPAGGSETPTNVIFTVPTSA
jgi:anti-sigma-K factor RskA